MEHRAIEEVNSPGQLLTVKALLEEYWNSLGFDRGTFSFGEELDSLPGAYVRPHGRLAMAIVSGEAVGCIALRQFDVHSCEMKRLFVRPSARGRGIAQNLLEWLVSEARSEGYSMMLADTCRGWERLSISTNDLDLSGLNLTRRRPHRAPFIYT